jgi:hypothetical protein
MTGEELQAARVRHEREDFLTNLEMEVAFR